jgi:peptidoglycan/LPS O-acetylase OafA/YrhL
MRIFWEQAKYAALYVYDFFFATASFKHSHLLDHFWSLSVEEQFYIFWPLLLLIVPDKWLKKLFVSFIFLGPLFRLVFFFVYRSGVFRFFAASPELATYPLPFSHMDAFALGAYISRFAIPKAKQQFYVLLLLLPVLGLTTQYIAVGATAPISGLGYQLLLPDSYKYIWAYTLLNYLFAVLVYGVAQEGWFTRFLEWRPLRYIGKISYGMYVYHFPIVWFSGRIADFGLGLTPFWVKSLTALIAFPATLLIASLSFHFLERPITNLKDRFFPLEPGTEKSIATVPAEPTANP